MGGNLRRLENIIGSIFYETIINKKNGMLGSIGRLKVIKLFDKRFKYKIKKYG